MRGEFTPEMAARPVDQRLVTLEERIPADSRATCACKKLRRLMRVRENLRHVMTRRKAELLQRALQRQGAHAAEAGTDNRECHDRLRERNQACATPQ